MSAILCGYTARMNSETLEQIQTKISFLERANAELGDVVYRQQGEIQALAAQLRAVSDRLNAALSQDAARPPEEERAAALLNGRRSAEALDVQDTRCDSSSARR